MFISDRTVVSRNFSSSSIKCEINFIICGFLFQENSYLDHHTIIYNYYDAYQHTLFIRSWTTHKFV